MIERCSNRLCYLRLSLEIDCAVSVLHQPDALIRDPVVAQCAVKPYLRVVVPGRNSPEGNGSGGVRAFQQ